MATCHSCWKQVPDQAPVCPYCGAEQKQAASKGVQPAKTMFGYAPSPEQLRDLANQQANAQQQQQPAQPQPPASKPLVGPPGSDDALAQTMFSPPTDAPFGGPPGAPPPGAPPPGAPPQGAPFGGPPGAPPPGAPQQGAPGGWPPPSNANLNVSMGGPQGGPGMPPPGAPPPGAPPQGVPGREDVPATMFAGGAGQPSGDQVAAFSQQQQGAPFGGPPGAPPPGAPPQGAPFGGPPGAPPQGAPFGAPPPGGAPMGGAPMGAPPQGAPMGAPPQGGPMGGAPMGAPPQGAPMGGPPMGAPGAMPGAPPGGAPQFQPGPQFQQGMGMGMGAPSGQFGAQAGGSMPQVKRMSAALWLILGPIMIVAGLIMTVIGVTNRAVQEILFVSWLPSLVGVIFFMIFIYKMWAALDDGVTQPTPGKALGFMFIPFFNIYWLFVALGSWGNRYNELCQRHNVRSQAPGGLFLFWAISYFIGLSLIMACVCVPVACGAVNRLADAQN